MPSHVSRINQKTHRAHQLGKFGEDFAELFLLSIGYEIVERNWRGAYGEIDLIATPTPGLIKANTFLLK